MNKAIIILALVLLSGMAHGATYIVPSQFVTGSFSFSPSAVYRSGSLFVRLDLGGYEKYIGKNLTTWWGKFNFTIVTSGVEFKQTQYDILYRNDIGKYCPFAVDKNCGPFTSQLGDYMFDTFQITNPNYSINILPVKRVSLALVVRTAGGDLIYATWYADTKPTVMASKVVSVSKPNALMSSCLNLTVTNNEFLQMSPSYSLVFKVPLLNPNPITSGAFDMFSIYASTALYWDGILMNKPRVFNNGTYWFTNVLNMSVVNFSQTTHRLDLCSVGAPNNYAQPFSLTVLDNNNLTIVNTSFIATSNDTYISRISPIVQSSTSPFSPTAIEFNLTSSYRMNWDDSFFVEFGIPSVYSSPISFTMTVTTILDNKTEVLNVTSSSYTPRLPIPKMRVFMPMGLKFKITGLSVPMVPGVYPFTIQLYSSARNKASLKHEAYIVSNYQ